MSQHPDVSTEPEDEEIIIVETEPVEFEIEPNEEAANRGTAGSNGGTPG